MKVYIGPYKNNLREKIIVFSNSILRFLRVSEKNIEKVEDFILNTCKNDIFLKQPKRKIRVKIHDYDLWSADYTLALIILPVLKKFRENVKQFPFIPGNSIPLEELIQVTGKNNMTAKAFEESLINGEEDYIKVWGYILDKMIFAFEHITDDKKYEEYVTIKNPTVKDIEDYKAKLGDLAKNIVEKDDYFIKNGIWSDEKEIELDKKIDEGIQYFGKFYRALWN